MRKIVILFFILSFATYNSQLKLGKYMNICYVTDAPSSILLLQKNSNFLLIYPGSVEQFSGVWTVKKDTLFLTSQYHSALGKNDSISINKKEYFLIKRKKLIPVQNGKCFLILKK
ncbi:hypothetical protein BOQ62_14690 [Chryseobacterium sp. CH21]|nr:hypothetical protein BOQ62_14690 [Chryseobacterium sp. CH21]